MRHRTLTPGLNQGKRAISQLPLWKRGICILIEKHNDVITRYRLIDD
jgi:hypothetical protein